MSFGNKILILVFSLNFFGENLDQGAKAGTSGTAGLRSSLDSQATLLKPLIKKDMSFSRRLRPCLKQDLIAQ